MRAKAEKITGTKLKPLMPKFVNLPYFYPFFGYFFVTLLLL
ncbi:hypothetical protein HMPREF6745_2135 [Prevotella sp. oral taxon 472 str. F0295]|nr:hypothetical protein HMPREF6745_2135 [Prevotella sp. oral taxon 472 str. F0295]